MGAQRLRTASSDSACCTSVRTSDGITRRCMAWRTARPSYRQSPTTVYHQLDCLRSAITRFSPRSTSFHPPSRWMNRAGGEPLAGYRLQRRHYPPSLPRDWTAIRVFCRRPPASPELRAYRRPQAADSLCWLSGSTPLGSPFADSTTVAGLGYARCTTITTQAASSIPARRDFAPWGLRTSV